MTQNREKTQKAQKDKKTSFPKESVENVYPYQPVLNKKNDHTRIMRGIQFGSSFKEMKRLKSLQNSEAYLKPKSASTMELF